MDHNGFGGIFERFSLEKYTSDGNFESLKWGYAHSNAPIQDNLVAEYDGATDTSLVEIGAVKKEGKRGKITIDGSAVHIELESDGQIWMSRWQLADLFGVYVATITANIKAIIKSDAVKPSLNCEVVMSGNTLLPELYDMDMIVSLAFRIDSATAEVLRKWVIHRAMSSDRSPRPTIFISCGGAGAIN